MRLSLHSQRMKQRAARIAIALVACACSKGSHGPAPSETTPASAAMTASVPTTASATPSLASAGGQPALRSFGPPQSGNAVELSREADELFATMARDDTKALSELLESPNRYLRAGALVRLRARASRLSAESLERLVALLNDFGRITDGECLKYQGVEPRGQGLMYFAADCSHNHTHVVSERAREVLLEVDAPLLGKALVPAFARDPNLADLLFTLVGARAKELARPLQDELVRAERRGRVGESDAAVRLLAHVELGSGEPGALEVLLQLTRQRPKLHAVRAKCVVLALAYEDVRSKPPQWVEEAYADLRAELTRAPTPACALDAECVSVQDVLIEIRAMRESAAPLLPEVVRLLDSDDEWLSLLVLAQLGEKARPAVPQVLRLLTRKPVAPDDSGADVPPLLEVIAAARPPAARVQRPILATLRTYPTHLREVARTFAELGVRLNPSDRRFVHQAYVEQCADAGSIANFSFTHEDQCGELAADLKKIGIRP